MLNIARVLVVSAALSIGLPYALSGQWWGLFGCIFAAAIWIYPSAYRTETRSTFSLFVLVGLGILGIFFGSHQLWSLTSFVLLLVAWDLDHYARTHHLFGIDPLSKNIATTLFMQHLKRLLVLAFLGWCLGLIALNIQINISFSVALVLTFLLILGLRQVARSLIQGR